MKVGRSILGVVATACTIAAVPVQAQAPREVAPAAAVVPTRVGVVDVQRVLTRSAVGVSAWEALQRDRAAMQKEVDGRRQELQKLRDEFEKAGPLLTAEARQEKEDVYERRLRDATRMADDFQKELEAKEQTLLQKVLVDISGIIERVAKGKGCALVVGRRGLLSFAAEIDLTEDVIHAYDQEAGAKGKR